MHPPLVRELSPWPPRLRPAHQPLTEKEGAGPPADRCLRSKPPVIGILCNTLGTKHQEPPNQEL